MYSGRKPKPDRLYSDSRQNRWHIEHNFFSGENLTFFQENTHGDNVVERHSKAGSHTYSLCETHYTNEFILA